MEKIFDNKYLFRIDNNFSLYKIDENKNILDTIFSYEIDGKVEDDIFEYADIQFFNSCGKEYLFMDYYHFCDLLAKHTNFFEPGIIINLTEKTFFKFEHNGKMGLVEFKSSKNLPMIYVKSYLMGYSENIYCLDRIQDDKDGDNSKDLGYKDNFVNFPHLLEYDESDDIFQKYQLPLRINLTDDEIFLTLFLHEDLRMDTDFCLEYKNKTINIFRNNELLVKKDFLEKLENVFIFSRNYQYFLKYKDLCLSEDFILKKIIRFKDSPDLNKFLEIKEPTNILFNGLYTGNNYIDSFRLLKNVESVEKIGKQMSDKFFGYSYLKNGWLHKSDLPRGAGWKIQVITKEDKFEFIIKISLIEFEKDKIRFDEELSRVEIEVSHRIN
uniref:Uncharacterized protein n=1 Tax=viral metagenome TaxID=1070528 RepID=A0A6C0AE43_9ZZZZ